MQTLKKLRPDHWAWLHAKAALLVWAALFFEFTPTKVADALQFLLATLISVVTFVGIGTSVFGLFTSTSNIIRKARRGLNIELAGLWVAISGPIAYMVTQIFLVFGEDGDQRIALTAFAYALCALMAVRIVIVDSHRQKVIA